MRKEKTVKGLGREAKERLKNGFWEKNKDEVITKMDEYKLSGVSYKEAFALYETRNREVAAASSENESFYRKVKKILDETGETSDILDRLIDKKQFENLSYESKQKYLLGLSEKYRAALARYKREANLQ